MAKVAELLGNPLMPWQRQVADVAGEIDPETGVLAYREVWVTVMRQSGKTTLVLSLETERCVVWDSPQRVAYTAQTGWEAKTKLLEDQVPILQSSSLGRLITAAGGGRVRRAQGDWGVNFGGGSAIDVLGSSTSAGHGRTIDLGVLDEAWKDEDDRREQAILPAMVTRPWAQLFGFSTMGTDASLYLNRKVEVGRAATLSDSGSGVAYFEWSIPPEADIDDPEVWWAHMPALGWTITESAVAHARQTMSEGEFRRAFGNQATSSDERAIPAEWWDDVQDPQAAPEGSVTFGLDVSRDRDMAAIAASDGEAAEVVTHREGTAWIVDWFTERAQRRRTPVVIDADGPAATIADELAEAGVKVRKVPRPEAAAVCGRLFDALADSKIRVRPTSQGLDDAVAGVVTKPVGDRFAWSRSRSSVDVTPLWAVTLAFGSRETTPEPRIRVLGA